MDRGISIGKMRVGGSYSFGFNGKENDAETGTQDYGMRIYNPGLGRFLSVDPIAKQYPELTPYQFASNRPIDGIDLDGLEHLSANESRVEFTNGVLQLKIENFLTVNRNAWNAANNNSNNWSVDANGQKQLGMSKTIANISVIATEPNGVGPSDIPASNNSPTGKPGNQFASVPMGGTGTTGIAKAATIVDAISLGIDFATSVSFLMEKSLVNEHSLVAQMAVDDVNRALTEGLIPIEYQNQEALVNIMNVVLQGVNNTTDPQIYQIGMNIYNTYYPVFEEPQKTLTTGFTMPADVTSHSGPAPSPPGITTAPPPHGTGAGAAGAAAASEPH